MSCETLTDFVNERDRGETSCVDAAKKDPGSEDSIIKLYCELYPEDDVCACDESGLNYEFGGSDNIPMQVAANPACTYSKCVNYGYWTANESRMTGNCPDMEICNLNTDISRVQDGSVVKNLSQTCNFGPNSTSKDTSYNGSGLENAWESLTETEKIVFVILLLCIIAAGTYFVMGVFEKKPETTAVNNEETK